MNKEEIKQRKIQIQNKIQYIDRLLGDPLYTLDLNKIKALEAEKKQLMEEYKQLPASEVIFEADVHEEIFYVGNRFTVKNGWLYDGTEALTNNIKFIDENTIEARKTIVSSDTLGLPIEMVYLLHIVPKKVEQPKPKKIEKPCSVQEAGESMVKMTQQSTDPNSEYFRSMGLVWDENLRTWRRPTPQEYAEFSKEVAKKKKGIVLRQ